MTAAHQGERDDRRRCGAIYKGRPPCKLPAGWGTSHVGIGRCKLHGGCTPGQVAAAQREVARRAVVTYGLPLEVDPRDALLAEVHRCAGAVAWLAQRVGDLDETTLVAGGAFDGPSPWYVLLMRERRHAREVYRDAITAGIEERRIRLAEQQGAMLAAVITDIVTALGHNPTEPRTAAIITGSIQRIIGIEGAA